MEKILSRFDTRKQIQNNEQYLDIKRAMENLKASLKLKIQHSELSAEQNSCYCRTNRSSSSEYCTCLGKQNETSILMKSHSNTLQMLKATRPPDADTLSFNTYNHDDIFNVLQVIQNSQVLDDEAAKSFTVGLKLFSEVMLEHKKPFHSLKILCLILGSLLKALKQTVKTQSQS